MPGPSRRGQRSGARDAATALYPWLKALHVAAMVAWLAGMVVAPAPMARAGASGSGELAALRQHFARVTTPAMIATLALGLWLAQDAGWFRARWLQAKPGLVFALAGLHGVMAGQLRRLAEGQTDAVAAWVGRLPPVVPAAVLGIATLAIVKPGLP